MNPLCTYCGFTVDPLCKACGATGCPLCGKQGLHWCDGATGDECLRDQNGNIVSTHYTPVYAWKDATRAGATRAAIDEAVAQSKAERDMVNHPPHYTQGAVECIDAIRAALGDEGLVSYCRGAAIKYLWRTGKKDNAVQDLEKAIWYITKAVEVQRGN